MQTGLKTMLFIIIIKWMISSRDIADFQWVRIWLTSDKTLQRSELLPGFWKGLLAWGCSFWKWLTVALQQVVESTDPELMTALVENSERDSASEDNRDCKCSESLSSLDMEPLEISALPMEFDKFWTLEIRSSGVISFTLKHSTVETFLALCQIRGKQLMSLRSQAHEMIELCSSFSEIVNRNEICDFLTSWVRWRSCLHWESEMFAELLKLKLGRLEHHLPINYTTNVIPSWRAFISN